MTNDIFRQETIIPKDFDAEQAVLGAIIDDNKILSSLPLTPNHFFSVAHQHIFRAILDLYEKNYPFDAVLIGDQLKSLSQLEEVGGFAYLDELEECCPSSNNAHIYAQIIKEHAIARDIIETSNEIAEKARDPEINLDELIEEGLMKFTTLSGTGSNKKPVRIKDGLLPYFQELERRSEGDSDKGIQTGFPDLDRRIIGFEKTDYCIVAARPGMGKTSFVTGIASYLSDKNILFFSLEMSEIQIIEKMLSQTAKVPLMNLRNGDLGEHWDDLAQATDHLSGSNNVIIYDESAITLGKMRSIAMKEHQKRPLDLIILDYMQLMTASSTAKKHGSESETREISAGIKNLCKDLNVPIIALSQLSRDLEKRSDKHKRPQLSDLRYSGALEQDADIILFIYRDEMYNSESPDKGQAEIIIAKQRRGPIGMVPLAFVGKYTKFANLAVSQDPHLSL